MKKTCNAIRLAEEEAGRAGAKLLHVYTDGIVRRLKAAGVSPMEEHHIEYGTLTGTVNETLRYTDAEELEILKKDTDGESGRWIRLADTTESVIGELRLLWQGHFRWASDEDGEEA